MTRLYGPRPKLHKIGTGYCRRCAVLFFSQENMQNCCRQQEKRRAHPTGLNSVRENTSSTGLSSVCADLPTRRYLRHCQRVAIHTARWYDYISTLDCCFPPLPLPPPTAAAFSQCISLPPPPLPPSTAAASPHRCCAPPSPLRPPIPAAFPLSYCVPSSLLPFVTGSGPPYQGSDPHN